MIAAQDDTQAVQGSAFDQAEFFRAIGTHGARALLIGRQALIVLGLPVATRDYDFWIHIDDIEAFNRAAAPFDLVPNHPAEAARARGRYVLENDERVDVMVARSVPTVDGQRVEFAALWDDRQQVSLPSGAPIMLPSIDGLILTKRFAARPKDAEDIRMLRVLRDRSRP
jgi:hypothetical protein